MLHIQMKYTKYHRKKKNSANDKTCFLFSYNLLYHKLKEPVWVAVKGECKISTEEVWDNWKEEIKCMINATKTNWREGVLELQKHYHGRK